MFLRRRCNLASNERIVPVVCHIAYGVLKRAWRSTAHWPTRRCWAPGSPKGSSRVKSGEDDAGNQRQRAVDHHKCHLVLEEDPSGASGEFDDAVNGRSDQDQGGKLHT